MDPKKALKVHHSKLGGWDTGRLGDYHDKEVDLMIIIELLNGERD